MYLQFAPVRFQDKLLEQQKTRWYIWARDGYELNYEPKFIMNQARLCIHKPLFMWPCDSRIAIFRNGLLNS